MQYILPFYNKKKELLPVPKVKSAAKLSYAGKVGLLILVLTLLKCLIAFTIDLGNDESYYWLYSQRLKWNYFDHPPMVAIWIRLFTANLALEQYEGFIRLGSIVGSALSTWFMYKAVRSLHSERAGWLAALLYNASFYAGIFAGLYIIPDAPQMVFWTFCLWMIARLSADDHSWKNWLLLGAAAGLCIMSKVHGIFIWGGFGLFILFKKRTWLLLPQFYAAVLLTAVIISPIIIWNIQHNFVTYRFHSERVAISGIGFNFFSFFRETVSQLLFNNPVNVGLILLGIIFQRVQTKKVNLSVALSVYQFIGLPLALSLLFVAMFRDTTLPHWSGPAYVTLLPLGAIYLAKKKERYRTYWSRTSIVLFLLVIISWNAAVQFYPGTFGSNNKTILGKGDNTLDTYGWQQAGKSFATLYQKDVQNGLVPAGTPVVSYKWWGAHVEYYFCRPQGLQMIGLGVLNDLHEYMWLNKERKEKVNFSSAYCIVPSDEFYNIYSRYNPYYNHIQLAYTIHVPRGGKPSHHFYIFRLSGWKNALPVAR